VFLKAFVTRVQNSPQKQTLGVTCDFSYSFFLGSNWNYVPKGFIGVI